MLYWDLSNLSITTLYVLALFLDYIFSVLLKRDMFMLPGMCRVGQKPNVIVFSIVSYCLNMCGVKVTCRFTCSELSESLGTYDVVTF